MWNRAYFIFHNLGTKYICFLLSACSITHVFPHLSVSSSKEHANLPERVRKVQPFHVWLKNASGLGNAAKRYGCEFDVSHLQILLYE